MSAKDDLASLSIKGRNFKSFGDPEQGLDQVLPLNIIIGRNNTGKSAVLDLFQYAISGEDVNKYGHMGKLPELLLTKPLTETEANLSFNGSMSSNVGNYLEYGQRWLGCRVTYSLVGGNPTARAIEARESDQQIMGDEFVQGIKMTNPLREKRFRRLLADRDIITEGDSTGDTPTVQPNGQGATGVIQRIINDDDKPRSLVEVDLLKALNEIFGTDAHFERILVQRLVSGQWEVFLEEKNKGPVPLSSSGSGLKTIILVLINLLLIPYLEGKKPLNEYIFAFEELENNLHPGLQRRLLTYLESKALKEECTFLITTHSNVIIDIFSAKPHSQIVHVQHDGTSAAVGQVKTYVEHSGIMDDLDVRASDLLQSNGVIWVEGPSDRLYLNHWINLISGGKYEEGRHYQIVSYGGRLLKHLSADPEATVDSGVEILRVNRHVAVLIDSDKLREADPLNDTKKRIIKEIEDIGGLSWVTWGKEIENYVPQKAIQAVLNKKVRTPDQYMRFDAYLNDVDSGSGDKFADNKVIYAEKFNQETTLDMLEKHTDLKVKLQELIGNIKRWNKDESEDIETEDSPE